MAATRKYTVRVSNSALGTSRFVGTFDDQIEAETYAASEASRSRPFVSFEVWTGTARQPTRPTSFVIQGTT